MRLQNLEWWVRATPVWVVSREMGNADARQMALFNSKRKSALAALMSVVAAIALAAYMSVPVVGDPTVDARAVGSSDATVRGVVKTAGGKRIRGARVRLVFRGRRARLLRAVTVAADGRGRFSARIPRRALQLRVKSHDPFGVAGRRRRATAVFGLAPRQSLEITIVFPGRRGGVLPGVFPY